MEPTRLDIDWLRDDDPVERFGSTIDRAMRQLAVEVAGVRAERDGLLLELEGVRAQFELVRQQLAERERFTASVRELGEIVRHLTFPSGWMGDARTAAHLRAASAIAAAAEDVLGATEPAPAITAPPVQPAPPAVAPETAPVAPPQPAPAAPVPDPAPVAAAFGVPAAPAAPVHRPSAPITPEPDDVAPTPTAAPSELAPAPAAEPVVEPAQAATPTAADATRDWSKRDAAEPSKQVERFFDGPGVWLGEPEKPERRKRLTRVLRGAGFTLIGVFVALVLFVSVGPRFLPYQTYFVRSGSMEPTIETGALIVLTETDAENLEVGDIISFQRPDRPDTMVTHRIHAVEENASGRVFVTKGDANGTPDVWRVPATGTGWKYAFGVPKVGYAVGYLGTPTARLALLAVPALLLGVLSLIDIWKPSTPRAAGSRSRSRRSSRSAA